MFGGTNPYRRVIEVAAAFILYFLLFLALWVICRG